MRILTDKRGQRTIVANIREYCSQTRFFKFTPIFLTLSEFNNKRGNA